MKWVSKMIVNKGNVLKPALILSYNTGILFFVVRFCRPTYEVNDDFVISLATTGVFGDEYKQYAIFSNIIYGYIVKFFSCIIPTLNWWVVLQYIIIVLSYSALFYFLCVKTNIWIALLSNMTVGCFVIYNEIRCIQFTRTAFLACIVGLIILLYGSIHGSKKSIIIGFIMSLLGSWIRESTFWLCMAYIMAFLVAYIIHVNYNFYKAKRLIIALCTIMIVVVACSKISKVYYTSDEGWREYIKFNLARANLLDYDIPSWEENQEKYEKIGFSENDVTMFETWSFNDSNKYTVGNLSEIDSWKTKEKSELNVIVTVIGKVCRNIKWGYFVVWFISLIIFLVSRPKAGKALALFNLAGTFLVWCYFYYKGRMVPRVEFGIWISAILTNILGLLEFSMKTETVFNKKRYNSYRVCTIVGMIFVMPMLMIINIITINIMEYRGRFAYRQEYRDLYEYISEDTGNLYVLDILSMNPSVAFCPYMKADSFYLKNYCWSGGWDTFTPYWKSYNEVLGFDNPIEDLCTKDNVMYVTNRDITCIFEYLQENYEASSVELIESYKGYNVYKFY